MLDKRLLLVLLAVGPVRLVLAQPAENSFTLEQRLEWAASNSISARRLAGYAVSSAIATAANSPREYGPHWDGYGKRVGLRLSTGTTGLFMESSIGAIWGEDPRYYRAEGKSVGGRLWHVTKMSFMARNMNGDTVPAYARYISVPANSFLSNTWRPDSHATADRALARVPLAFVDRIIANSFSEFLPDIMKRFRKKNSGATLHFDPDNVTASK